MCNESNCASDGKQDVGSIHVSCDKWAIKLSIEALGGDHDFLFCQVFSPINKSSHDLLFSPLTTKHCCTKHVCIATFYFIFKEALFV